MKKLIDIIIPAYNARNTLDRALSSVAMQTIIDKIKVTIVSDGDNVYYGDIVSRFREIMDVQVLDYVENRGVGYARQYGVDKTNGEYIAFLDADDTFAGAYALEMLLVKMQSDAKHVVVVANFFEKRQDMSFVKHENDMVWVHGKLYKRSFLDKYGIRFLPNSANEDAGFNRKVQYLETENERIAFLPNLVYYWHWTDTAITKVNNFDYTYNKSFIGFVDNMIDTIEFLKKHRPNDQYVDGFMIEVATLIYIYNLRIEFHRPELMTQTVAKSKEFYNKIIKKYEIFSVDKELEAQGFVEEFISKTIFEQSINLRGIVPYMTFWDFIYLISDESDENDTFYIDKICKKYVKVEDED